jgi:hypothetical protein
MVLKNKYIFFGFKKKMDFEINGTRDDFETESRKVIEPTKPKIKTKLNNQNTNNVKVYIILVALLALFAAGVGSFFLIEKAYQPSVEVGNKALISNYKGGTLMVYNALKNSLQSGTTVRVNEEDHLFAEDIQISLSKYNNKIHQLNKQNYQELYQWNKENGNDSASQAVSSILSMPGKMLSNSVAENIVELRQDANQVITTTALHSATLQTILNLVNNLIANGSSSSSSSSNNSGSFDQDLNTTNSPSFAALTISGVSASRLLATNSSKALVSVNASDYINGTSSQISVSNSSGVAVLALPSAVIMPGSLSVTTSLEVNTTLHAVGATTLDSTLLVTGAVQVP